MCVLRAQYTIVGLLVVVPALALTALLLAAARTRRAPLAFAADAAAEGGEDDSEDGGDASTAHLTSSEAVPVVSPYGAVTRVRFPVWTRGAGSGIALGWGAKAPLAAAADAAAEDGADAVGDVEEASMSRRSSTATLTDPSKSLASLASTSQPRSRTVSDLQHSPARSAAPSSALALSTAAAVPGQQDEAGWHVPVFARLARWLGRPARAQVRPFARLSRCVFPCPSHHVFFSVFVFGVCRRWRRRRRSGSRPSLAALLACRTPRQ